MKTQVHRLAAAAPDDVSALAEAIDSGMIVAENVVAVLGKTEGNGCVNDFTRAFATKSLKALFAKRLGQGEAEIEERIAFVMSGGTEGGLSPHWLVFEVVPGSIELRHAKSLAVGVAFTREFLPEEIGRMEHVRETARAVREAMAAAHLDSEADVHYVQVKCPLLTAPRIAAARERGRSVATQDTYESMGYSRGASALGVALALGEIEEDSLNDQVICRDYELFSRCASTSAGIELMRNEIMVLGNSPYWNSELVIGHAVMADGIDAQAVDRAMASVSAAPNAAIAALLCKAEPSRDGLIRGNRHIMCDDSDIHSSRHARALVGGVLAGRIGDTQLFVSGGAEHQGPDGGGPLALLIRYPGVSA